ncbi:MAG: zf-HC2 domain-containing protein [Candidatus Eremiobacteraeota bacterium]|nr:zf-HC2 domain-containing protein [Candidatus Eremiobacteraeota bacterium]
MNTQHLTTGQLIDYVHSALSPAEDAFVYAHLETCQACRAEYEAETAVGEMLRAQARAEERELPSTVKAAIWNKIRSAQPTTAERLRAWFRPAFALPVAAALVIAAYFGSASLHRGIAPAIEAAYYLQDHDAMNGTVPFGDRTGANPAVLQNENSVFADETAVTVQPVVATTIDVER